MPTDLSQKHLYLYTTIAAIFASFLWGTAFPVLKVVYQEMHIASSDFSQIITFISIRFFLAGLIVLGYALYKKQPLFQLTRKDWITIVILGLCSTTIQYFFFNIGVNNTSGIKASILGQIGIFFSVILAHFLYKNDRLNKYKVAGLCLGFLGLVVVNFSKGSAGFFSFTLAGEGFMLLSGLMNALSMFIVKKLGGRVPTLIYTGWQMLIGSLLLFLLGIGSGGRLSDLHFTPLSVLLLIYLALLSSVAFVLWYAILQYRKIGEISLFKFVVPITGSLLTALFNPGEKLLPTHIIGLALVSVGIIVVNYRKHAEPSTTTTTDGN